MIFRHHFIQLFFNNRLQYLIYSKINVETIFLLLGYLPHTIRQLTTIAGTLITDFACLRHHLPVERTFHPGDRDIFTL